MEKMSFSAMYIAAFLEENMRKRTMEEMSHRGLTGTKSSMTGIDPKSPVNWDRDLTRPSKFEVAEFLTRRGIGSGSNNYMSLSMSPVPMHKAPDLFPPGGVTMWG